MPIDYYYHWLSPPCRTVSLVIKHLNLDVNYIVVDMSKGEHKKDNLLKVSLYYLFFDLTFCCSDQLSRSTANNNGNGFALDESRVIVSYLCNKYASDNGLYPKDTKKRAQVDRILYFDVAIFYPLFKKYLVSN